MRTSFACFASFLGLTIAAAAPAGAQTDHSFEAQLWHVPIAPTGYITIDSASVLAHKQFALTLSTNYQRSAFQVSVDSDISELQQRFDAVKEQVMSELAMSIGLFDKVEIGIGIPMTLSLKGTDFDAMGQAADPIAASGLGDIRIEAKIEVASFGADDAFTFAVAPGLTLPTGDQNKFLGDKTVTGRLRGLLEFRAEKLRAAAMLGFLGRGTSHTLKAEIGSQMLYGTAIEYKVHKQVGLIGEWFGRMGSPKYVDANPSEIDVGMRVSMPYMLTIAAGGGAGINRGLGAPRYRGWVVLGWAPDFSDTDGDGIFDADDQCPSDPEDKDGFRDGDGCPEPDNDGDGILDGQDKCPTQAEDLDQFQDEDGCPEADNDQDGIPDLHDPCPNAKEDGRGKKPTDGCPSTAEDSDGDGVPDNKDKCPAEAEDRDGFEDDDGCPEIDNDNDGIPDQFDQCPVQAEDPDGFQDEDGCPDPDNDKDDVPDAKDKCPLQAGPAPSGCPRKK